MLTNDLSNNNIPASAPPPPPPLPLGGLKNWTPPQDNGNSKKPSNVATSGISSRTEPKKGQSKSPVQQSSLNFAENPLFKKKQEEHNVNSETADEGSNIRQSEPNRGLTPKPVSPRVLSPQQDNGNSNKPSGTNNSTQSEKGLSENPIQLATEQKIDTPILVNTSVGISKATALKYSIATLLLCISSVTAGIYTYLSISVTLSDPVLFTVIASVSALVMLSSAVYLINSHISAINSEKGVDPGRKQSQYSELQKEAESLGHSNTPTPSFPVMSGTPSAPPPPTLKNNTTNKSIPSGGGKQQESGDLMADLFKKLKKLRKVTDEEDDVQQRKYSDLQKAKELEHSNTPTSPPAPSPNTILRIENADMPKAKIGNQTGDMSATFAQIKERKFQLKKVKDNNVPKTDNKLSNQSNNNKNPQPKDLMTDSTKKALQKRRNGVAGEEENVVQPLNGVYGKISSMITPPRSRSSSVSSRSSEESEQDWSDNESTYSTPLNPQLDNKKRSESPDSGHESDDNEKSKPTSPLHSAGKPLVPPKTAGLQTKSEASPAAQVKNVDPVNTSHSINSICELFGGKANKLQKQNVAKRY